MSNLTIKHMKSKMKKLNEVLDVAQDVAEDEEIMNFVNTKKQDLVKAEVELSNKDVTNITETLDAYQFLHDDFINVRDTLNTTIKSGREMITALTDVILTGDEINAELVSAYSSLISTVNSSSKLMIDTYEKLVVTKDKINKLFDKNSVEGSVGDVTVNNNIISVSTADILKKVRGD